MKFLVHGPKGFLPNPNKKAKAGGVNLKTNMEFLTDEFFFEEKKLAEAVAQEAASKIPTVEFVVYRAYTGFMSKISQPEQIKHDSIVETGNN